MLTEVELDVDDDAVQWVNVLLETVKLLLLTIVLPEKWLQCVSKTCMLLVKKSPLP